MMNRVYGPDHLRFEVSCREFNLIMEGLQQLARLQVSLGGEPIAVANLFYKLNEVSKLHHDTAENTN